jgi:hypothetical protein
LLFGHLKHDGILVMHISNRYLDLRPVLATGCQAAGKLARLVESRPDLSRNIFPAMWALISGTPFSPQLTSRSVPLSPARAVRTWTDDYSNLLQSLR